LKEKLDIAELERRGWALACEGFSPPRSEEPPAGKTDPKPDNGYGVLNNEATGECDFF